MNRDQRQAAYSEVETKARHALEHVKAPLSRDRSSIIIQLLMEPSFDTYVSWTVFKDWSNGEYFSIEVKWKQWHDFERFRDAESGQWRTEPTLQFKEASLNVQDFDQRFHIGSKIQIPLMGVEDFSGADGVGYSLKVPNYFGGFHLFWWEEGPPEWRELTAWAADMQTYLSQAFASG
jgi:hypothetical protein